MYGTATQFIVISAITASQFGQEIRSEFADHPWQPLTYSNGNESRRRSQYDDSVERRYREALAEFAAVRASIFSCHGHRAPPVSVELSSLPWEPGFPTDQTSRRVWIRHRMSQPRSRVPLRSRSGRNPD